MPAAQINPPRLQAEPLRRWYLRPPDEIEGERQARADAAYDAFFSPAKHANSAVQVAAATAVPPARAPALPGSCLDCHAPPPLPLPNPVRPAIDMFPWPIGKWPLFQY